MCLVAPLLLAAVRCLHRLGGMPQGALLPLAKTFYLIPLLTMPFSALSGFAFPLAAKLRALPAEKAAPAHGRRLCLGMPGGAGRRPGVYLLAGGEIRPALHHRPVRPAAADRVRGLAAWAPRRRQARAGVLAGAAARPGRPSRRRRPAASIPGWLGSAGRGYPRPRWSPAAIPGSRTCSWGWSGGQYSLFANGQLAAVFPDDDGAHGPGRPDPQPASAPARAYWSSATSAPAWPSTCCATRSPRSPPWRSMPASDLITDHLGAGDRSRPGRPAPALPGHGRAPLRPAGRGGSRGGRERFDLVFIHQPDAWTAQLNRYYTREFFLDLKKILAPGGVVALRLRLGGELRLGDRHALYRGHLPDPEKRFPRHRRCSGDDQRLLRLRRPGQRQRGPRGPGASLPRPGPAAGRAGGDVHLPVPGGKNRVPQRRPAEEQRRA